MFKWQESANSWHPLKHHFWHTQAHDSFFPFYDALLDCALQHRTTVLQFLSVICCFLCHTIVFFNNGSSAVLFLRWLFRKAQYNFQSIFRECVYNYMCIYIVRVSMCHTIQTALEIFCAGGLKLRPMCLFNATSNCYSYVLNLALGGGENYIIVWMCSIWKRKKKMNEDRKKAWNLDAKAVYGTAFKISATLSVFFLRGRT